MSAGRLVGEEEVARALLLTEEATRYRMALEAIACCNMELIVAVRIAEIAIGSAEEEGPR